MKETFYNLHNRVHTHWIILYHHSIYQHRRDVSHSDSPPSMLTSTLTMPLPPPEYEYPLTVRGLPGDTTMLLLLLPPPPPPPELPLSVLTEGYAVGAAGVVMTDCTGCSCRLGIFSTSIPSRDFNEGLKP